MEKPAPTPEQKKTEEKPKDAVPMEKVNADGKAPVIQPKPLEKPIEAKSAPAYMLGPAALGPTGTKITKIFEDRLLPPNEKAMKDLPVPKDGESYFITLHPAYLEKSEFNTVSVDTSSDDYKELKKSIELNGVKDPVLTRINPRGGLEILSGQRAAHDRAGAELSCPRHHPENRRQRCHDPRSRTRTCTVRTFLPTTFHEHCGTK